MSDIKMQNGFVCVFDILGTKQVWKENNAKTVLQKRAELVEKHEKEKNRKNKESLLHISMQNISDTYIISAHINNEKKFQEHYLKYKDGKYKPKTTLKYIITKLLEHYQGDITNIDLSFWKKFFTLTIFNEFVRSVMLDYFDNGLFIRGCISYDRFYIFNDSSIIGPAIDRASQEYEKTNWIGIHFDNYSTQKLLEEKLYHSRYQVPFKGYSLSLAYLDWSNHNPKEYYISKLEEAKQKITAKNNDNHNDVETAQRIQKYDNTIQFIKDKYRTI